MKLIITNVTTHLKFTSEMSGERRNILNTINYKVNPLDPQRYMKSAFRRHVWDGRMDIVDMRDTDDVKFPTGLYSDVYKVLLHERKYYADLKIKVIDKRAQTIKPEVPNQMIIGGHKLRDYQLKGIRDAIRYQRVTINSATNSGKTSIAVGITKIAQHALDNTDNILLFTYSKDVAKQDKASFEKALGIPVGFLGSGKHIIHQVTCGTTSTISSALRNPAKRVNIRSRKEKDLQYMHDKYVPRFIHEKNKSYLIKAFVNTHRFKFSYDQDCRDWLVDLIGIKEPRITKALAEYNRLYDKMLLKKNKRAFTKYKKMKDYLNNVKVVFVDEAQHAPSKTGQKVLNNLPNARIRVALTGTVPTKRLKHAVFVGQFGHHIMKVSNHALIKRGISAIPKVTRIPIHECTNPALNGGKPFNLSQEAVDQLPAVPIPKKQQHLYLYQTEYKLGIIENTFRNATIATVADVLFKEKNGITLIVVNSLKQGKLILSAIRNLDPKISVEFLQGKDDIDTRTRVINAVNHNKLDVLIATQIINEGLNMPSLENMIYASGGKSSIEVLQRVGRLLRKYPKQKYVYIFDIEDCTSDMLFKQSQKRLEIYAKQKFQFNN